MKKNRGRNLGRLLAGIMAILLVIGLIPEGLAVSAAGTIDQTAYTNEQARGIIAGKISWSEYTKQMSRVHQWSKTSKSGFDKINGEYYSTSDSNGVCTWCAVNSLLNRYLALRKTTFSATKSSSMFDMSIVAPAISNTPAQNYVDYQKDSRYYLFVGKKPSSGSENIPSYSDNYTNASYVNKANDQLKLSRYYYSSSNANSRKTELKNLLDAHPEGVVVQFTKWTGKYNEKGEKTYYNHGIVISSYYGSGDTLRFRVVDSVDIRDGSAGVKTAAGESLMEEAWIGRGYENGNNANTIIANLQYVLYVSNYTQGSSNGGGTTSDPVSINNLSIDGKTSSIVLVKGKSANLMGTVSSGVNVTSVNAVIKNEYGSTVYNSTIYPQAKSVDLKSSALNTGSNCIKFGTLAVGDYTLTITAKDAAGKSVTKTLPFTIAIKIDLSSFNGNLTYGKSYSIPGTIISAENISKIYARVVNGEDQYQSTATYRSGHAKAGKKVECTVTGVNAKNFNIKSSAIDNNLSMGGLRQGNYYFEVTVTDVSGNVRTVRKAFSVR